MSDTIFIKSREIPLFGEPISEHDIKLNSIYYIVNFVDENMMIPVMKTVVFVGKNLEQDDNDSYYFQDIDSYNEGILYNPKDTDSYADFYVCSAKELNGVYDFEHALERLMHCSLRQRTV